MTSQSMWHTERAGTGFEKPEVFAEREAEMNQTTDLTLFLNQVALGMIQNEAMQQWLTDDPRTPNNQGFQWDPDLIDQWMREVNLQHP